MSTPPGSQTSPSANGHLSYLAEPLAAEIDDRAGRRRSRRIGEARFPRIKRLADFNTDAIPGIAATLATLAAGAWIDAGEPGRLARGQSYRLATSKTSSRKRAS